MEHFASFICSFAEHMPLPEDVSTSANYMSISSVWELTYMQMGIEDALNGKSLSMDCLSGDLGSQLNRYGTTVFQPSSLQWWPLPVRVTQPFVSPVMAVGFYHGVEKPPNDGEFFKQAISQLTTLLTEDTNSTIFLLHFLWHPWHATP